MLSGQLNQYLTIEQNKEYIQPIEEGMLVELQTMADYKEMLISNGLEVVTTEDISQYCNVIESIS